MIRRLRRGEWIAVGGLVGLAVSLFLVWFNRTLDMVCAVPNADGQTTEQACPDFTLSSFDAGWGALGRPWMDLLIVLVIVVVVALAMTLRAGPGRPTYGAVVSLIAAGFVTALVTVLTAIRVLLARPSGGTFMSEDVRLDVAVGIGPGGWIGLASLVILWIGLWVAVADDRTDAPDSAFDPPAPRPVPEAAPGPAADAPASPPDA